MIIKLKGANFSTNNINALLNSYFVSITGGSCVTASNNIKSVSKDSATYSNTFTVNTNYSVSNVEVTMGGSAVSGAANVTTGEAGTVITISVPTVTGNISIKFTYTYKGAEEPENPGSGEVVDPETPEVGGDGGVAIEVSARTTSNSHADALPTGTTSATNLWTALTPEAKYYDSTGTYTTYNSVSSVVFPVKPGDKITASSFGTTKESNGVSHTGIRITYLLDNTVVTSLTADTVASEYKSNGYVTVPSGVNAVNIPVWDNTQTGHEVYLFPAGATGTPTKPSNYNSGSGSGSGSSSSGGNIEVEDTSGATWYVNHLANGSKCTADVNIAGRGWAHVPGSAAYNAYVGKPVNTIGFFTNKASQNVTIGKVAEKGGVDTMETIATVTAVNPSGTTKGFCYVTFPTVTLADGECLAMFAQDDADINFYYSGSASLTDANGIVDTNFYGRVPKVYGSGKAWTDYSTMKICLGISVGYIAS